MREASGDADVEYVFGRAIRARHGWKETLALLTKAQPAQATRADLPSLEVIQPVVFPN